MGAPKDSEPLESQGVLANLPHTRPQRSSPRRAAARKATATAAAPTPAPARSNGRPAVRPESRATRPPQRPAAARAAASSQRASGSGRTADAAPTQGQVPRQGFECDGERAIGPVSPPGGPELMASAAEIIGELAKAGLSTGERVVRDVLSRLPLS